MRDRIGPGWKAAEKEAQLQRVKAVLETCWLTSAQVCQRFNLTRAEWARIRQALALEQRDGDEGDVEWHARGGNE